MARKPNRRERRARQAAKRPVVNSEAERTETVQNPTDVPPPPAAKTVLERMAQLDAEIMGHVTSMPPRWVKFARCMAEGSTQVQAAIDAGFAPANARQQGHELASRPQIVELVEKLQMFAIVTEAAVTKPAIRRVLTRVMTEGSNTDAVAAARAAMRLEGLDRQRVEITGAVQAIPAEDLRKQLADRLARQRGRTEEL